MMKKYLFALIVLLSVLLYTLGRRVNRIEVLRVGCECDYPPNNWEEDRKTDSNAPIVNREGFYAEGYDIQIAKAVAEKIGARLEVKKILWQDLIPALQRREIDAIFSGMLDTDERKARVDFSDTYDYFETEYAIIVHKDSKYAQAQKLNDFYGAVITGQAGTALDVLVEQVPGAIHVEPADTFTELLDKLLNNDVDGIVINVDTGEIYEKSHQDLLMVRFPKGKGFKLNFTGTCVGVRKKNDTLLRAINSALSELSKRDRQRLMDMTILRQWENINI